MHLIAGAARVIVGDDRQVKIRKTTERDIPEVCRIYAQARDFMRESGNPDQWGNEDPTRDVIESDVRKAGSYVCVREGAISAVFYFNIEREPAYEKIDGRWLNDKPYGVVHRIARIREAHGAGAFCLNWCFDQHSNIRIDTHRDNAPMRKLLDRLGFSYCGIIWLASGKERIAFQKILL